MSSQYDRIFGTAVTENPQGVTGQPVADQIAVPLGNVYAAASLLNSLNRLEQGIVGYVTPEGNLMMRRTEADRLNGHEAQVSAAVREAQTEATDLNRRPSIRDIVPQGWDFASTQPRAGAEAYQGRTVLRGDFSQLPEGLREEALADAQKWRDMAAAKGIRIEETQELRWAARLDGREGLSNEELASAMIAISMTGRAFEPAITSRGPSVVFDGSITPEEVGKLQWGRNGAGTDQQLVFETARQVFGDLLQGRVQGGQDTTGPEGNQTWANAMANSPQVDRSR